MGGKSRISKQISEVINNSIYGWKIEDKQENIVFVSEEQAPDDFNCIWAKEFKPVKGWTAKETNQGYLVLE